MYIYLTQNLLNGKIYIGQSSKNVEESEFYLGSGVIFLKAVKKYGRKNFKKSILFNGVETQEELDTLEIFYINFFGSRANEIGYNVAGGGLGGQNISCKEIWRQTLPEEEFTQKFEDWKEKISKNSCKERSQDWKENISKSLMGHKHLEMTREKISSSKRGKKNKLKTKKIIIFNENDEIQYEVDGYFRDFCIEHDLPGEVLMRSYRNGGERIYQNLSPQKLGLINKNGNYKYIGWYAKYKKG